MSEARVFWAGLALVAVGLWGLARTSWAPDARAGARWHSLRLVLQGDLGPDFSDVKLQLRFPQVPLTYSVTVRDRGRLDWSDTCLVERVPSYYVLSGSERDIHLRGPLQQDGSTLVGRVERP